MWFFCSNSYQIEVMITFLIEILELPNFGRMTTSTIYFDSRNEILFLKPFITEIMAS